MYQVEAEDAVISLRDRARFALLDREAAQREHLVDTARDVAAERLGVSEIEIGLVDLSDNKVEFKSEGLTFRSWIRVETERRHGVEYEQEIVELHIKRDSYWDAVRELADVGVAMRRMGTLPQAGD